MTNTTAFNLDHLVEKLKNAALQPDARAQVKALMEETMSDVENVRAGMPDFEENDVILFEDETVSIWHCRFMPGYAVPAHDHQISATIGVYDGVERNDFYENDPQGTIRRSSSIILNAGDVLQIGPSAIHSVACASENPCCGIHVYLGALTTIDRALFDTDANEAMPFTDENYQRLRRED